jgi:hypothetical protein
MSKQVEVQVVAVVTIVLGDEEPLEIATKSVETMVQEGIDNSGEDCTGRVISTNIIS